MRIVEDKITDIKLPRIFYYSTIIRVVISILSLIFFVSAIIFIPYLRLPIIANIIFSIFIIKHLKKYQKNTKDLNKTFGKRLFLVRFDGIISLIIWLPYFIPILKLVF